MTNTAETSNTWGNPMGIESAKILTISTAHLCPDTVIRLEASRGNIPEGPSVALRNEGYLVNSHLGDPGALENDHAERRYPSFAERFPDLTLIRALARGLGAEWVNIDADGVEYSDILPTYDDNGLMTTPAAPGWAEALRETGPGMGGRRAVIATRETLEAIEAGQTPGVQEDPPAP